VPAPETTQTCPRSRSDAKIRELSDSAIGAAA